jgi:fluoroacetyl-CoA thioesterase
MAESADGLVPGLERSDEFTVAPPLVTDVGGTIGTGVLSTPGMIGMMEASSQVLAYEHLPEGKATVGFEVCIKHVAAAAEGVTCRTRAVLRTIGVGTHERRVVGQAGPPTA